MEILQRKLSYVKPYYIEDMKVNNITFYNSAGVICTTPYGYLQTETGEDIKSILVCNIKRVHTIRDNSKRVLKAEKLMQEHINFSISLGADEFGDKLCELYLYVDNNFIKQVTHTTKQSKKLYPYTLQEEHTTKNITTFNINSVITVVTEVNISITDSSYSQLVIATKQELDKKFISISNSDLAELLNRYKLVERDIPLSEEYKRKNSEAELIK